MSLDKLLPGSGKKKEESTKKGKKYKSLYLDVDTITLLYDLVYTEKSSGNFQYTMGDAIKDGIDAITKGRKLKKATDEFINSKGTK